MNDIINQEIINQVQLTYENIPLAVFLLGTNGSGKSSLRNYLNLSDIQTNIDPDVLNRIYKNKYPQTYKVEAGKQALKMYDDALAKNMNICLERTLAGHGTMNRIIKAKQQGYYTIAYYIGLNSVELNLERIAMRVARGGHNISDDLVHKRYNESMNNLVKIVGFLDKLQVVDNSDTFFRLQFELTNNIYKLHSNRIETWASELSLRVNNS